MSQRRRHVALVAFYYPPSRASGIYRMLALGNQLHDQGWDVTVVTVTPDFFDHITRSSDPSLVSAIRPGIRVERVPMPMQHLETQVRRFSSFRGNFPELHRRLTQLANKRLWQDPYAPWVPGVLRRLLRVHARRRIDVTLATGNPYSSYGAVWAFRRLTGTPYVLDSRDSWTLDLFTGDLAQPEGHAIHEWERRYFTDASAIAFVNEPLLEWHQRRYPELADRMLVAANGFDPAVMPDQRPAPDQSDRQGVRFGYVGTLTKVQPHDQIWPGWALARDRAGMTDDRVELYGHLGFFGLDRRVARMIPTDDPESRVLWLGPVAKLDVAATYANLDVLMLIVADSPYVTSGKVFEYMATGKPILGLYGEGCAAGSVLADYPLLVRPTAMDPESIADAFVAAHELTARTTDADRSRAAAHAKRFERTLQLQPLVDRLSEAARR